MQGLKSWLPGRLARSTALVMMCSSLLFALLIWALGRGLLIPSFEAAERRLAHDAAIHTRDVFLESAQGLSRVAADWANWDGAYDFVRGGQLEKLQGMFTPKRFADLGIDFMVFFSADGSMRLTVESSPQGIVYNSSILAKSLTLDSEFGRHLSQLLAASDAGPQAGVVRLPFGAHYLILSPVRPSHGVGLPGGYMVWGVRAEKILLRSKAAFFSSDTQVLPVTSRRLPDAVMQWVAQGMPGGEVLVLPSEYRVASWIAVRNLDDKPALLLGRSTPREVSALAVSNINLMAMVAVAGILVVGLIALYLLQVRVVGRLHRLSLVVGRMRGQGPVERLLPDGQDEVADLALGINALIDDKNRMLQERDESEQRFAFVFANSMAGMLLLQEGRVSEINASAILLFHEKTPQQLLGRPLAEMLDMEDARSALILALLDESAQAGEAKRCECRLRRADGSVFDCDVTATVLLQGDSKLLHLHLDDVTERKTVLHRMHHMAFHDSLTGLVNRNLFHDRLAQTLRQQQRDGQHFAVLFIDLDGFKAVNDNLGHAAGDALLQTLALRMNACVRANDTLSRLSGDEFALLLTGTAQPLAVIHLARRVLAELSHPVQLSQGVAKVTASIGVLLGHAGYTDAELVLHDADVAMYRAKREGKNRIVLYRSVPQSATEVAG